MLHMRLQQALAVACMCYWFAYLCSGAVCLSVSFSTMLGCSHFAGVCGARACLMRVTSVNRHRKTPMTPLCMCFHRTGQERPCSRNAHHGDRRQGSAPRGSDFRCAHIEGDLSQVFGHDHLHAGTLSSVARKGGPCYREHQEALDLEPSES